MAARTLYDKLWDDHAVRCEEDGTCLLYIDRQLIHEVTSPQAFAGLRLAGRRPWRVEANLAVPDHNVPAVDRLLGIADPVSKLQVDTLEKRAAKGARKTFLNREAERIFLGSKPKNLLLVFSASSPSQRLSVK